MNTGQGAEMSDAVERLEAVRRQTRGVTPNCGDIDVTVTFETLWKMIAAYDAVAAERDEARREVAQVVAWLRNIDRWSPACAIRHALADAIAAGAHKEAGDVAED